MTVIKLLFYFFFYSFVGWFFESCYCSVRPRKWVNRGFLRGPICPIYGTGAMVLMLVILPFKNMTDNFYLNIVLTFVVGLVVCDIVELFHARWWDYSKKRFNIQGRICLTHTIYWGIASCLFLYILHPFIDDYFIEQINPTSIRILVYIFLTVFAADLIDTVINALGLRNMSTSFLKLYEDIQSFANSARENFGSKVEKFSDERKAEIEAKFNELRERYDKLRTEYSEKAAKTRKRLVKAFPSLQDETAKRAKALDELLEDIKNKINKKESPRLTAYERIVVMSTLTNLYCRAYQGAFKVAVNFLDWTPPQLLKGPCSIKKLPPLVKS